MQFGSRTFDFGVRLSTFHFSNSGFALPISDFRFRISNIRFRSSELFFPNLWRLSFISCYMFTFDLHSRPSFFQISTLKCHFQRPLSLRRSNFLLESGYKIKIWEHSNHLEKKGTAVSQIYKREIMFQVHKLN